MISFFDLNGYGWYVWPCYGLMFIIFIFHIVGVYFRKKKINYQMTYHRDLE